MAKFSTGLFVGALIGMGVAIIDKRTMKKARKMAKTMMRNISHYSM